MFEKNIEKQTQEKFVRWECTEALKNLKNNSDFARFKDLIKSALDTQCK